MKKQLFLLLSLGLAATHVPSSYANDTLESAKTVVSALAPFGICALFTCCCCKHIDTVLKHKEAKEIYLNEEYKPAYSKASSEVEKWIADGTLVVPVTQKKNVFIADVIEIAISEGNVLTEKLSEETIGILKNKNYAFSAYDDGFVKTIMSFSIIHGIAAWTLNELVKS